MGSFTQSPVHHSSMFIEHSLHCGLAWVWGGWSSFLEAALLGQERRWGRKGAGAA